MVGRRAAADTVVDHKVAVADIVAAGHTELGRTAAAAANKVLAGNIPYMVPGLSEPA